MALNNTEQEMMWINSYNDLIELIEDHSPAYIVLPNYIEANLDTTETWIQSAAYDSNKIIFNVDYYKGKLSVFIDKEKV